MRESDYEVEDEYSEHTYRHLPYITSIFIGVNLAEQWIPTKSCVEIVGFFVDDDLELSSLIEVLNRKKREREFIEILRDHKSEMMTNDKISLMRAVQPVMVPTILVSDWSKGKLWISVFHAYVRSLEWRMVDIE